MKGGAFPVPVAISVALLGVAGAVIVGVLGSSPAALWGAVAGLVLGWLGSGLELRLMQPHIHRDLPYALRILTAGFGIRLLAILGGVVVLEKAGLADGAAFGAAVVAAFLCFLPVLSAATRSPVPNGEARG